MGVEPYIAQSAIKVVVLAKPNLPRGRVGQVIIARIELGGLRHKLSIHIDRYQAVLALYDDLQRQTPRADLYIGRDNIARRVPGAVLAIGE